MREAVICPHCGVPTLTASSFGGAASKDKTAAVLLAVFLGPFTWLYTYDRDATKFWIGLGVGIASVVGMLILIGFLGWFGIWIWSIVDVASKPESYYRNFPNG